MRSLRTCRQKWPASDLAAGWTGAVRVALCLPTALAACLVVGCAPQSSRELLDAGFQANGNKAIQLYSKSLAVGNDDRVEAYWRRGDEYYKLRQYARAIADFDRAIALDSAFNNGYLFGDRGEAKEALADYAGAIQDYTTALRLCHTTEPSTPRENFYFYRARTELKAGDTLAAGRDTDSALQHWEHFPRARFQKGRLEVIKGHYQTALPHFLNQGYGKPLAPEDAADPEFTADVFYYGLLKYKLGDTDYCPYWQAAATYGYAQAATYLAAHCPAK